MIQNWRLQALMSGANPCYDGINSEPDFTNVLKAITVQTFMMHGDGDQNVPIADCGTLKSPPPKY